MADTNFYKKTVITAHRSGYDLDDWIALYRVVIANHKTTWESELQSRGYTGASIRAIDGTDERIQSKITRVSSNPERWTMYPKVVIKTDQEVSKQDAEAVAVLIDDSTRSTLTAADVTLVSLYPHRDSE